MDAAGLWACSFLMLLIKLGKKVLPETGLERSSEATLRKSLKWETLIGLSEHKQVRTRIRRWWWWCGAKYWLGHNSAAAEKSLVLSPLGTAALYPTNHICYRFFWDTDSANFDQFVHVLVFSLKFSGPFWLPAHLLLICCSCQLVFCVFKITAIILTIN